MSKFDNKINNYLDKYIFSEKCGKYHENDEDNYEDEDEMTAAPAEPKTKPGTKPDVAPTTEPEEPKRRNPLRPQPGKKSKPMAHDNDENTLPKDVEKFMKRR